LDETLWYTADWDLWLKISICSDTLYCPKPLSGFRIHLNSQTITRSSYPQDFRAQLNGVAHKYLALWDIPESSKKAIGRIADFSIEVNAAFANAFHGKSLNLPGLLISFLLLGPSGWYYYLQNSRILERVSARLKAQLKTRLKK
jgi:hypothetical protein